MNLVKTLFEAAKRGFLEETGFAAVGEFIRLKDIMQPSGKVISARVFEGDCDAKAIRSNSLFNGMASPF